MFQMRQVEEKVQWLEGEKSLLESEVSSLSQVGIVMWDLHRYIQIPGLV